MERVIVEVADPPGEIWTGLELKETVGPVTAETLPDSWMLPVKPRLSRLIVD